MKSRKGFTLVELIGVIILIGLIALIAIPSVDYVIKKTEDNAYEATVKTLMDGLRNWTTDNKELVYEDGTEILLTLTDLKEQGYVDFDIRNPKTKLCLANNMQFKITRVKSEEKDKYEFEIMGNELLDGTLKDCEAVSKTPSIYLLGDNPQKIEITNNIALGYEAYDPGVVAKSTTGEDLTHSVVKTNDVKLNILGKNYHAKYTIIENGISKTVTRKVHVVDTTAPELHVPEDLEIELGETLNLLEGVAATDNSGETPKIKTSGNVNFNKEGEYKVTYIATDSSGNSVSKDRVIKVTKPYYILKRYSSGTNADFHGTDYRSKIVSIEFVNGIGNLPAEPIKVWDLSEARDNSIKGWLVEVADNPGYYDLFVGSDGYILANPDSSYWFADLSNLYNIIFTNYYTMGVTNMSYMFKNISVGKLDLSGFDTSNVTNMTGMFNKSSLLTEIELRNFDTSKVTSMASMFSESGIINLDLSNFDTSNVTNMSSMFYKTMALENLNLSTFNTSKVTTMVSMFESNATPTLDLSSFDTSNVTNMTYMFMSSNANYLDLRSFNTSNVTSMGAMFYDASAEIIDITSFDTSNVTTVTASTVYQYSPSITYGKTAMFQWCNAKEVKGLENLNTSKIKYMDYLFYNSNIKNIDLSKWDTSNVTSMSFMFAGNKSSNVNLGNIDTSNVTIMNDMFYNCSASSITIGDIDTSKVNDMSYMFARSSATILDVSNLDTGNVTDMSNMFGRGYHMSEAGPAATKIIGLEKFDTRNVKNMYCMFCKSGFETIDISTFDTSNVTSMSNMFALSKATSIVIGNIDTSNVTNMSAMFGNVTTTSLDVSGLDTQNVTSMSDMFGMYNPSFGGKYNSNIENIIGLENFNTTNVTDMNCMFRYVKVTNLNLSSFDTSNVINMQGMFSSASLLRSLDLSNFSTAKVSDMSSMFSSAKSLTNLNVSNFDTSSVTTMSYMFSGVSSLTTLDLGSFNTSNVTNMSGMFNGMSSLTTLDVSNFDASKVTTIGSMFKDTINLKIIKTPINIPTTATITNITSYDFTGSDGNTYAAGTFPTGNTESITLTR